MSILQEVLSANEAYADDFGAKGELALPPARRFAILTCMDARLDPAKYAGLSEGDAHVIRNAGGRASDDAIRSLVISYKLLGTAEWFVIHHTDCGMEFFTDEVIRDLLAQSLETAALGAGRLQRRRRRAGVDRGQLHRLAHDRRHVPERGRRRRPHPRPPAGAGPHPGLRLRLRRPFGPTARGRGGHEGRRRDLRSGPRTHGATISRPTFAPVTASETGPDAVADEVRSWIVEHWDADLLAGRVAPPPARIGLGLPDMAGRVARAGPAGVGATTSCPTSWAGPARSGHRRAAA